MKKIFTVVITALLFYNLQSQIPFEPTENLSQTSFATSSYQTLFSDGSRFYVVWGDNGVIKFKFSSNAGVNWTSNVTIPSGSGTCGWPSIAVNGSNVYVIYHALGSNDNIYFNKSTDNGQTWTSPLLLSSDRVAITPQLVCDGDDIYAVWEERINTNNEIFFRKSTDGGETWTPLENLSNNSTYSRWVQIQRQEGVLYLAWLESPSYPDNDIYFSKSFDDGGTWTTPVNITNDALPQDRITLRVNNNNIYIVSSDIYAINFDEVGFMKSTDYGETWSEPVNLSNNAGNSDFPNIYVLDHPGGTDRIYLAWYDNTHSAPNYDNLDIYFKYSTDSGESWSVYQNLSTNPENSYRPHVRVSNHPGVDSIGVCWFDYSTGDAEILFRRGVYSYEIPVELVSFSADIVEEKVLLNWSTATETNNSGFEIQRKSNLRGQQSVGGNSGLSQSDQFWEGYTKIGFVDGKGTTTKVQTYSFVDDEQLTGNYKYRLKQIDYDGSFEYSNEIEIELGTPQEFSLEQNYPNPFNPSTKISFSIPETGMVKLKVYNILGKEIVTLINEIKEAGKYDVNFSAKDLNSGIYFYKLETEKFSKTKKMLFMK